MEIKSAISRYLEIAKGYPELFNNNENLFIILDRAQMEEYASANNKQLGIIYESRYYLFAVDLVTNKSGELFTYSRIINLNPTNGVVIIPVFNNKIGLLRQLRHATRQNELELPRGFSEPDIPPQENAKKELFEEIGATTISSSYLGSIVSDSGVSGGKVDIFAMEIDRVGNCNCEEGISSIEWHDMNGILELIQSNEIRDSFTISAVFKYLISKGIYN